MHIYGLCGHGITILYLYVRWGVHVSALSFCVTFTSYAHRIHIIIYIHTIRSRYYIMYIEQHQRKHEYGRSLFGWKYNQRKTIYPNSMRVLTPGVILYIYKCCTVYYYATYTQRLLYFVLVDIKRVYLHTLLLIIVLCFIWDDTDNLVAHFEKKP